MENILIKITIYDNYWFLDGNRILVNWAMILQVPIFECKWMP